MYVINHWNSLDVDLSHNETNISDLNSFIAKELQDKTSNKNLFLLLSGTTASGKTDLAIKLAQYFDGLIINTDSMQIYSPLRILTARPSEEEEKAAPHHLYGFHDGSSQFSVFQWGEEVKKLISQKANINSKDKPQLFIFVGGTGFYFNFLTKGLSPVPHISDETKNHLHELANNKTNQELYDMLMSCDNELASRLKPNDSQRILRGLGVYFETKTPLSTWQNTTPTPLISELDTVLNSQTTQTSPTKQTKTISNISSKTKWLGIFLNPERQMLYNKINARFDKMIEQGVIDEVKEALPHLQTLPAWAPILKAHGLPEITSYLKGEMLLTDAIEKSKQNTRNYAKRQWTWWRPYLNNKI